MKRLNISLDHPSIPLNVRRKMVDEEQLRIRLKEKMIIFQKKKKKQPRFGQLWCFCRQWKPAIKLTPYAGRLTKMEKITDMNQ